MNERREKNRKSGRLCTQQTCVVFDKLLQRVKLRSCSDVVSPAVELADLVMFHIVSFGFIPVSYGERISTWRRREKCSLSIITQVVNINNRSLEWRSGIIFTTVNSRFSFNGHIYSKWNHGNLLVSFIDNFFFLCLTNAFDCFKNTSCRTRKSKAPNKFQFFLRL